MQGNRREDQPIGDLPTDPQPGDYWRVMTRDGSRPLDVRNDEDKRWWGDTLDYSSNLTGGVWGIWTPFGQYGMLSIHTVRENEDGTINVVPGDGSSNSILVSGGYNEKQYHGYIYNGDWQEC